MVAKANPSPRKTVTLKDDPTDDPWGDDSMSVLVWGESGKGKTTFASTFPAPILWLICSGSKKSSELKSIDTPENRKRIFPERLDGTESLEKILGKSKYSNVKTVVLDHVSGFQDLAMQEHLGLDEIPALKSWDMGTFHDWAKISEIVIEHCRILLDLPVNKVIIGQERVFDGVDSDKTGIEEAVKNATIGVGTLPSTAKWLHPSCNYSVQAFTRPKTKIRTFKTGGKVKEERVIVPNEFEFCLRCVNGHDVYLTKVRLPKETAKAAAQIIVDPTYDKFLELLDGKLLRKGGSPDTK